MKKISLDNGQTYMDAHEAIGEIMANDLWNTVARFMDSDTREAVHADLAPCTEEEFLSEYLLRAPCDLIPSSMRCVSTPKETSTAGTSAGAE